MTLTLGSEFLMDQISLWWIWTTTTQKILEEQLEEYALQLDANDFACLSKAKAKPQRREPAGSSPRIVPMERRNWIDIEPGKHSLSEYEVSKKLEDDGAVHFWKIMENLQDPFPQSVHWSDSRWKACLAAGGGAKRRFQYCNDDSGTVVYFRALQGHSGRNLVEFQDNVVIPFKFFQKFTIWDVPSFLFLSSYLDWYLEVKIRATDRHIWINTWKSKFEQQTDSILSACWSFGQKSQGSWCDRLECTASCTIPAQCMEETSRRGNWERIDILSDSIECNHPSRNTSSFLSSKSC